MKLKLVGYLMIVELTGCFLDSITIHGQELYEERKPLFESIRLQLPIDNYLSRKLGSKSERIHVYFREFVTIDDNVFLSDTPRNDNILISAAGSYLTFEAADHWSLSVWGEYRYFNFDHLSGENHSEMELSPTLTFEISERLSLDLSGIFKDTSNPLDDSGVQIEKDKVQLRRNGGTVALNYIVNDRWGSRFHWRITDRDYESAVYDRLDLTKNTFSFNPFYVVSTKAHLGLEIIFRDADYDEDQHNELTAWEGGTNVRYKPSEKFRMSLSVSYQNRDIRNKGTSRDTSEFDGFLYLTSFIFDVTAHWHLVATSRKTVSESSSSNYYTLSRHEFGASWRPTASILFDTRIFSDKIDESESRDKIRYGGSIAFSWTLCEGAGLGASYEYAHRNGATDYTSNKESVGFWFMF